LGLKAIAERTGYTTSAVQAALRKMGVPMRPQGNAFAVHALKVKVERLERENKILRERLKGLRRKYREAA